MVFHFQIPPQIKPKCAKRLIQVDNVLTDLEKPRPSFIKGR